MDKYRVWHTEWEEFVTDYPICMNVLTGKIVKFNYGEYSGEEDIEDTKYILSKYAGLKDKNDVEIFEGDVVRVQAEDPEPKMRADRYETGVIIYTYGSFDIETKPNTVSGLISESVLSDVWLTFEVLGNIYEHPHLLEE